ncbi:MAG TPA: thioredoxin-dependent thiol peroxidase [Dehalococcoidia bacterium]|nr:thioredoxin-dependent thiol peroxidase [Dehalococcoidia bacterium]
MPTNLKPGDVAPDFDLPSDSGERVRLRDLRGKRVVLYFYPKDDTPGCTTEACSFRDAWTEIQKRGIVVLGVSKDSPRSHVRFKEKYSLPFTLLSDEDHAVADAYGVWGPKTFMGRQYEGMDRATFLIGPDGRIEAVWPKVKPEGHAEEVLAAVEERAG